MRKLVGCTLIALLTACGSGATNEGSAPATESLATQSNSAGSEQAAQTPAPAPAAEPAPAEPAAEPAPPQPQGPGKVTIRIVVDDKQVPGDVEVLNGAGDVVAQGASGDTLDVPAGDYVLQGKIKDPSIMVDTPSQQTDTITVEPGQTQTEDIEIGRAKVRLKILKHGHPVRGAQVDLKRQGSEETVYSYKPGEDYIYISPGRYDAVVHMRDKSQVKVQGLVFIPGATQDIPVRIQ